MLAAVAAGGGGPVGGFGVRPFDLFGENMDSKPVFFLPAPGGGRDGGFAFSAFNASNSRFNSANCLAVSLSAAPAPGAAPGGGLDGFLPAPGGGRDDGRCCCFFRTATAAAAAAGGGALLLSMPAIPRRSSFNIGSHLFDRTNSSNSLPSISPEPSSSIFWYKPMGASNHDLPRACPFFLFLTKDFPSVFKQRENSSGDILPPPSLSAFLKNSRDA